MTTEIEIPELPEINGPKIAKRIAKFVVKHSVATTVGTIIGQNVEVEKKNQKVQLFIGGYVLGMMAAEAGWNRVEQQARDTLEEIKKVRKTLDDAKEKNDVNNVTDL